LLYILISGKTLANTGINLTQRRCLENKTNSLKVVRRKTHSKEEWDEKNQIKRRGERWSTFLNLKNIGSIQPWVHSTLGEVNRHEH
jgi:hypothetical protein